LLEQNRDDLTGACSKTKGSTCINNRFAGCSTISGICFLGYKANDVLYIYISLMEVS